jgi:hypothetical protein
MLDFDFFATDTCRFVPMKVSLVDGIISKADGCDAFAFALSPWTVDSP